MPGQRDRGIFISYAHKDGAELAARLQRDLAAKGHDAWLDTQRLQGGAIWTAAIEQEIDTRQVTLALLTPGSYESEICRAEQLRALRKGKRLIPLLAAKDADVPLHLEARQFRDFSDSASYQARFQELLGDILGDVSAALPEAFRRTRTSYITAPPTVANYLERPEAIRALRDTLFARDHRRPVALTALVGMGGIGKTVLAQALIKNEAVQDAFPDGIVWITVGRERTKDFTQQMREVAKALGDDLSRYDNPQACQNEYRTTIAAKAALIVVDDVWSTSDVDLLLAESPRSRFLLTTRDASIGRFLGAREHHAELLDLAQSRELLAAWADSDIDALPKEADEIIDKCGQLPLALSQIGAVLRGGGPRLWTDTLDLLRKVDLSAIQEQIPQGQESFFRSVEVSFKALTPKMQERYKALAVLLEDMSAPLPVLQTIWNVAESEAQRTSKHFVDRSLAQGDSGDSAVRLHDLQLDYVRAQYPNQEALDLVRGAVRLSSNVIGKDPTQFASQVMGRLLPHQSTPAVDHFTGLGEGAPKPWLRLLHPALHPPGTALIRTLEGHSKAVTGVAVSADGRRAISASSDNTLKVWDVESGRELHTLEGHSDSVLGVAVSADGGRALSASDDNTLKVWDVESGRELHTLEGHSGRVNGVAVSADGRRAISASYDKALKVWDVESGRELRTLEGHSKGVNGVAVSADGRRAISASDDKTLKVWDVETGRELRTVEGHSDRVTGVAVSADGRRAISASDDNTLKVWDVETGRELRTLEGHSDWVNGLAVSADGRRAISASDDNTLKVWDVETGRELRTLVGHSKGVTGVAVSADGRRALSASSDNTLKVWDVESGRELRSVEGHSDSVRGVAVSADGRRAISASDDKTLKLWDVESGRELHTLEGHSGRVNGVAVSADGRRALSASSDNTLKVWDVESGRELHTLEGHSYWVIGVAVSVDGRRAISASADKTLKVWDVESGRELRTLEGHSVWVNGVAVSADGRRAISASYDNTLKVWDVESGRELRTLEGHSDWVNGVAVSADGQRAISASADNTLKVWDVESGRELHTLVGHSGRVNGVAVSADGRRAISASADNTLKVWDVESGTPLATFTCEGAAFCCTFINNHKMVGGDLGGSIYFLSLEEAREELNDQPPI